MKWLLRLYPPGWQRRYRREVAAHLASEPVSMRTALDLLAGAVDAWRNPQHMTASNDAEGESNMVNAARSMITAARCGSVDISPAAATRSAILMVGTTLVLTVTAVFLKRTFGPHILIDALLTSAFFIALTVSSLETFLKPYSGTARGAMLLMGTMGWYLFFLGVAALAQAI